MRKLDPTTNSEVTVILHAATSFCSITPWHIVVYKGIEQ